MNMENIMRQMIDLLIRDTREDIKLDNTWGIKTRYNHVRFFNSLVKRISYALESENALLSKEDLQQTVLLNMCRASANFTAEEMQKVIDSNFDMSMAIVQRFYAYVCQLARYDIYMLTAVKYKKHEEDNYFGTEYYTGYGSEDDDEGRFVEKLLHDRMEAMMIKPSGLSTALDYLVLNSDIITKGIKENNVEFLYDADRRNMSKSSYDSKVDCLKKSLKKGVKALEFDINQMSRREAMYYTQVYNCYKVCNGAETVESIRELLETNEEILDYLYSVCNSEESKALVGLFNNTISDEEFMTIVTKIVIYANELCKKYGFEFNYKYRSIDIKTGDEVYYFDLVDIKKALGIKDIYVVTRVLRGDRSHYKGLKFEQDSFKCNY